MRQGVWRVLLAAALVVCTSTLAFAQGSASITGQVTDSDGGVIPGVTVVITNNATGAVSEAVTGANGFYTVTALQAGTYTVRATLTGFKTAQTNDVRLALGVPSTVNLTLEVGQLAETVNVTASGELVNTQTATVTSTLNADQINRMPTATRNALNAVTFLPGVNTATTNRASSINGLPGSFVSITMDGASNDDNFQRDGFFANTTPRQDAVEAVTVTMAGAGAEQGGSGAVTIAFQTRSGSTRFSGSLYDYFRDTKLNSIAFFNKVAGIGKNEVRLTQIGGRVGGPVIPGKMFYFLNYEQVRFPVKSTRTRSILPTRMLDGWFPYETTPGVFQEVNLLTLAANRGQISTIDPTILSILQKIDAASKSTGVINPTNNPRNNEFVFLNAAKLFEHQPTARIDYNLTDRHRLSGTASILLQQREPDYVNQNTAEPRFPGSPNYRRYYTRRPIYTLTLRSTLSTNLVNELTTNATGIGGKADFGTNLTGPETYADFGGYAVTLGMGLTNWHAVTFMTYRNSPSYRVGDTLNWQRGAHSLSVGADWQRAAVSDGRHDPIVPTITLGFNTTLDPAAGMFTTAITGIPSAALADARAFYSLLTGRVTAVNGAAALDADTNKYVPFGRRTRTGHLDTFSGFVQDAWRITPTVTVRTGLRYDVQMPFSPTNDIMTTVLMEDICGISGMGSGGIYNRCNFFQPGASGGTELSKYTQLTAGFRGYNVDWNNVSPSLSVAWRPNVQGGWLRRILGDPDQATLRAGYSVAFAREGLDQFTNFWGANQGSTLTLNRNVNTGLVPAGESWPVLFSQRNRLGLPAFNDTPTFPILTAPNRANSLNGFDPDFEVGRGETWTLGVQRAIGSDMAVEVRYVGTRGTNQLTTDNYNEIRTESLLNNGFLNEFKLAMANLQANNAAGGTRAGSFRYFGAGTGTSPLPTYLAYLNGSSNATNTAAYTGTSWADTTLAGRLVQVNPNPVSAASDLDGNATRRANALAAGLAANLFVVNPRVNAANVRNSAAFSKNNALQIELRRRLSRGLSANVNYQYAISGGSDLDGFTFGRTMVTSANVRHAFKGQWDWTLPVGRGQRFGADMHPVLDAILGGWSMNGVGRIQARVMDFGNVRLVGMSIDELTDMYKFYQRPNSISGRTEVYMLPEDVILNTRRAFGTSTTSATGYGTLGVPEGRYIAPANSRDCIQIVAGDCAPRTTIVRAPWFTRFDIGMTKRFNIRRAMNVELRADVLNVLDNINFTPVADPGAGATIFRVTEAYSDLTNTYDPGGRVGQLMIRFNW